MHQLLTEHAFWAAGRSRKVSDAALDGSRCYGLFDTATGEQVAFARVVTDGATFGWLADVVVEPAWQRRGLGRYLVEEILADLEPFGLRRILLKASDEGRGLYPQLGWTDLEEPDAWMVWHRDPGDVQRCSGGAGTSGTTSGE